MALQDSNQVDPQAELSETSRWRWSWLWAAFLVAVSFASYSTVLVHGGWIWDDPEYVTQNPNLRGDDGMMKIWTDTTATPQYYPLVYSTFRLEYQSMNLENERADDFSAFRFHFNNILIFALTALLFWRVLARLRVPGALLTASIFAVHPVNVESVAWVTERKNMLSGMFAMAAVLLFLRFVRIGHADETNQYDEGFDRDPRWGYFVAAMSCWILGLLSKTVIAFVPPALLLILWWKRPRLLKQAYVWVSLGVMLIPGLVAGIHTAYLEKVQVGASDNFFPEIDGFMDRVMLAGKVVWVYAGHVVAPIQQMFFYPKWDPSPASITQWMFLLAALGLIFGLLAACKKIGRGPLVAILIFGGALVPVMGFNSVYPMRFSWVADHFQYHANFAFFALIGAILVRLPIPKRIGQGAVALVMVGLGTLSNQHGLAFQDAETLWRKTIEVNPNAWLAHQNLGVEVRGQGKLDEAFEHYYAALEIHRAPHLLMTIAIAYMSRYVDTQDPKYLDQAEKFAKEGLAAWPKHGQMHQVLGNIYSMRGPSYRKLMMAEYEFSLERLIADRFQRAFLMEKLSSVNVRPMIAELHQAYLLEGQLELNRGNPSKAMEYFSKSVQPFNGPGTQLWRDLGPWLPNTPWFLLELHRIWMLTSFTDPSMRNPEAALAQIEWLLKNAPVRLQGGMQITQSGTSEEMEAKYILALDCQAACLATLGRFRLAIEVSSKVLESARRLNAPENWLKGALKRSQVYRAKSAYRFSKRVPT